MTLKKRLIEAHGLKANLFRTIGDSLIAGVTRNLSEQPLTNEEAAHLKALGSDADRISWLVNADISSFKKTLSDKYDWFADLGQVRQEVIIFMYSISGHEVITKELSASIIAGDFESASDLVGELEPVLAELSEEMRTAQYSKAGCNC